MKSTAKAIRTREQILDAALGLFQEKGFDKTTMRDIAHAASMSVGASYYYFRTKDELVLAFYTLTQEEAREKNKEIIAKTKDFKKRLDAIIRFKFDQLRPYRSFLSVIARSAGDAENQLSPFSSETAPMREDAINLIREAMEGSNLKVSSLLRPHLPKLLWFYQMGLNFYWIHDRSPNQAKTEELHEHSSKILTRLITLSTVPLMRPVNRSVVKLLSIIE